MGRKTAIDLNEAIDLVPEITQTTDPCQEKLEELETKKKEKEDGKEDREQRIANAKVSKPQKPEAQIADVAGISFVSWGAIVLALFLFHCIIWCLKHLFDITWNTWGWTTTVFFWGLGICVLASLGCLYYDYKHKKKYEELLDLYNAYVALKEKLTPEIKKLKKEIVDLKRNIDDTEALRCQSLGLAITKGIGVPYPTQKIDSNDAYFALKPEYLTLLTLQQDSKAPADSAERAEKRKIFMNAKLDFFYRCSLQAEISQEVYQEFHRQYKKKDTGLMVLRTELPQRNSQGVEEIKKLPTYLALLDDNTLQPIMDKMDLVKNRDTKGFLFFESNDKKTAQTKEMQKLVKAANAEYKELMEINDKVMYALNFVRGCAYRNIYLGVELLNYIRDTAGGGTLATVDDANNMENVDMQAVKIDALSLKTNLKDAAVDSVSNLYNFVSDAGLTDLALKNPKCAAGATALAAIGGAALDYFSKVNANAETQAKLVDTLTTITDGYTEGQKGMIRAIEVIKGIVKSNTGFMAIYEPLKKKYLEEGCLVPNKVEIAQLAKAINEYKKTSESKL